MAVALALLAAVAGSHVARGRRAGLAVFGLGFGIIGQVLIGAVQNGVDRAAARGRDGRRRRSSAGSAARSGAAALGAVFAARTGMHASEAATRADVTGGVQVVLAAAVPLALAALALVLLLKEVPLAEAAPARRPERREPCPSTS